MLTLFRSKAGADVLMLGRHAADVLTALGREPSAQGVFRGAQLEAALACWSAWPTATEPEEAPTEGLDGDEAPPSTGLRQRAWPLIDLLRRAQAQGQDVVWQPA